MATLTEIASIVEDSRFGAFRDKVRAACVVKAAAIIATAAPGDAAKEWAKSCLSSPGATANQIVFAVIGANDSATLDQIFQAADTAINSNVSDAVDKLYGV